MCQGYTYGSKIRGLGCKPAHATNDLLLLFLPSSLKLETFECHTFKFHNEIKYHLVMNSLLQVLSKNVN